MIIWLLLSIKRCTIHTSMNKMIFQKWSHMIMERLCWKQGPFSCNKVQHISWHWQRAGRCRNDFMPYLCNDITYRAYIAPCYFQERWLHCLHWKLGLPVLENIELFDHKIMFRPVYKECDNLKCVSAVQNAGSVSICLTIVYSRTSVIRYISLIAIWLFVLFNSFHQQHN